jgi:hypothetical protein
VSSPRPRRCNRGDGFIVSVEFAQAPFRPSQIERPQAGERSFAVLWVLLLWQIGALVVQVLAVRMSRLNGGEPPWVVVSCIAFGMTYASALWALTRPQLTRAVRNTAVICLGMTTAVQYRATDPLQFTGYDEQLHMRTLRDIGSSHGLFQPHPTLAVSPRYPGLESLTTLVHQFGLPVMAAATAVVLVARLALVLALCDAVERLTGSPRAGGLAVAVYAVSAQFTFFNTSFAYQTLALPLAVAAVAFIARARWAPDPRPLLIGATVCLLAVAVTHHITSWLTAAFLAAWATAESGGQARRRVFYGTVVAVAAATSWAIIQWSLLRDYFAPIVDDVVSQATTGVTRKPFSDPAGFQTPTWERIFLVYYSLAVTFVVALLMLTYARSVRRQMRRGGPSSNSRRWDPRALLLLMAALVPVTIAVRVMPSWAELGDRLTGFLFLPFSLLVADLGVRWFQSLPSQPSQSWPRRLTMAVHVLALLPATAAFVAGMLMGNGPDWAHLPGRYLAEADNRSMDAETLAAVRWAGDELPAGSRITADRVSSILLASQAGLWPVVKDDRAKLYPPRLYFADEWGPRESELSAGLYLQYLYVDRRLALESPHEGAYFYKGETEEPQQLTQAELTKFDNVPGIRTIYRHGPISIYDLSGLNTSYRTGWFGKTPATGIPTQLAIGLLSGLVLALVARSTAGYFITKKIKSFQITAGPSLTFATGLATVCAASVMLLLAHIWLGPIVFLSMALAVLLVNHRRAKLLFRPTFLFQATFLLMNGAAALRWKRWIAALGTVVVVAIAQAILGAYLADVAKVRSILDDPSAVHMPVDNLNPAGGADGNR